MDPNNSRPMSYDSLKILLQYAKPNLRFELSRRIPSIRLTEKAVPLRIDNLLIGGHGIHVNNSKYIVRTIRFFPPSGIVPRGRRFDYLTHDSEWDLDEWGFDDFSSETVFTPGDLVLQAQEHNHRQRIQNESKKDLENRLKYVEWIIAKKSGENVESEWAGEAIDTVSINWMENSTVIELKSEVERIKIRLAPYNCLENNVPLPFIKMVQVTVNSENGNLCWRYSGNRKCYEIRKQLITWLLGNWKPVIQVNYFTVINGIIARLPENLRICIKKLNTTFLSERTMVDINTMMNKLEAILQQNHPLDVFETDSIGEDFDHPLATTAKKLIISEHSARFPDANRLIRIPNQKMYIHAFMFAEQNN
ncbi:unnamed protein product [Caenorhabditis brenneri]